MKHERPISTISDRLGGKRKQEVLMLRANQASKLAAHVAPTHDRATGLPDGGTRSALLGAGGVCQRCGQTRDDIINTAQGKRCDAEAYRRFSLPLDLAAVGPVAATSPALDPLADLF